MVWNTSWLVLLHLVALAYVTQPLFGHSTTKFLLAPELPWWLLGWAALATECGLLVALLRFTGHWLEAEAASLPRLAAECDWTEQYFNDHASLCALTNTLWQEITAVTGFLTMIVVVIGSAFLWVLKQTGHNELTIALTTTSLGIWLGTTFHDTVMGMAAASGLANLWIFVKAKSPVLQSAGTGTLHTPSPALVEQMAAIIASQAAKPVPEDSRSPCPYKVEPDRGLQIRVPTPADDLGCNRRLACGCLDTTCLCK
jgi:hypothetical protein